MSDQDSQSSTSDEPGDWRSRWLAAMKPPVFIPAALVVIGFVVFGGGFTETASETFTAVQGFIVEHFGWLYLLAATGFVGVVLYIFFSRYGKVRLGADDSRPEFSTVAWFAMLFSAGMGTGLLFWGVAEPLRHYTSPPFGADGETNEAARVAMKYAFFHWGLHPWAIYIVIGLPLAYFHFRRGLPLTPSSLLEPIIGERRKGAIGHAVDVLCVTGTLFGVATSLGLGAMQINTGLSEVAGVPRGIGVQLLVIAIITAAATTSVVLGLSRGIQRLSLLNVGLAAVLLLFVFTFGPTLYLIETFVGTLGTYVQEFVELSLKARPGSESGWQNDWTFFYWAWWISWSPFVGMFVARVSKGRTIRQFVGAVLLVPALVTFVWLSVFGGAGLFFEHERSAGLADVTANNVALSLHAMLEELPWGGATQILATALIVVFFITSSDSGSLVDDMITSGGHPNPPKAQRVFWAVSEGAVAATLLVAGGLEALQTASLSSGLPMAVLLIVSSYAFLRALRSERGPQRSAEHSAEVPASEAAPASKGSSSSPDESRAA